MYNVGNQRESLLVTDLNEAFCCVFSSVELHNLSPKASANCLQPTVELADPVGVSKLELLVWLFCCEKVQLIYCLFSFPSAVTQPREVESGNLHCGCFQTEIELG